MKKILYTFAALLFFAACTQEQVIPEEPVIGPVTEPADGLVSVTLVADSPETRTELGTLNDKPFPFWSAGDNVWVLPAHVDEVPRDQYGNAVYPATLFEGGLTQASPSASFTGDLEAGKTYLAFYPDREVGDENDINVTSGVYVGYNEPYGDENYDPFPFLSFAIPTEQYPTRNSFDKAADFLVSAPFTVAADQINPDGKATVNVGFTRMNAIVKVVLHDMTTGNKLSGQVVKKVVLGESQEMDGGGEYAPAAHAETRAEYFDPDGVECNGLTGSVGVDIGEDGECEYFFYGDGGIAAIYTDGSNGTENTQYPFDENGQHTTYFITMPCVIKNDNSGHGLRLRVETDDMVIERDVNLPEAGIALQPSRMTTLNIGLYDNGVKETTIMENGFSFMWYDLEADELHTVSSLSVKEDSYEELFVNLVGVTLDEENWADELVSCDPESFVHVDFEQAYYESYSGRISGVRVWGDQATDSPVTVTFSAGGYSTDLQVNVVEANTPASISLGDISEINLDQYDAPSLNATITPKYHGQDLEADFERFACELVDQDTGAVIPLVDAVFEESDDLEMVIDLPEISAAGEFNLVFTYKDVTLLTIPITVWEDADLPAALQSWSGPSRSYYLYALSNWFDAYKNTAGGLKTYAASLAEEIPTYAFAGALKLESSSGGFDAFKYFTGLTEVPEHAFVDCQFLTEITLPGGIITIGDSAFENCKSLINIQLPESVTSIGNNAFVSSGIVSINLPDGLESIGEAAFSGCHALQTIVIPGSIKTIGDSAFSNAGLSEVSFSPTISQLETLPLNVFYRTASLTSISIPQSVKVIGESAFSNSGLASVVIPEGVTTIEESAFSYSHLTTVTLPSSVTSIGEYAFANCPMVSATLLPVTPPTVWGNAFRPTSENENFEYPIYVPDNSYDSYTKAAANWGEAAGYINTDRIKKMSEAPAQ